MKKSKVACFFATEKGYNVLNHITTQDNLKSLGCVVSFKETNVRESYYEMIKSLCEEHSIPFYTWSDISTDLPGLIEKHSISLILTISWRYLLPMSLNEMLEEGIIIFHDSLLPKYRGFSPTPTAIICGETEIGVSAIFASEKVDGGDIILQRKIAIEPNETIKSIFKHQSAIMAEMFIDIISIAKNGKLVGQPQNEEESTYSIWRGVDDCQIDWSKSAEEISSLVRAVGIPYPGAFCYHEGKKIIIDQVEVLQDINFAIRDFGKIWTIVDGAPHVICGSGILRILSAFSEDGYKFVFSKVRVRLT